MGNVLYGDLGSEHLLTSEGSNYQSIISTLYSCNDSTIMAGYMPCGARTWLWYYSNNYNARGAGYLSGTISEQYVESISQLNFSTVEEFEDQDPRGSMTFDLASGLELSRDEALRLIGLIKTRHVEPGALHQPVDLDEGDDVLLRRRRVHHDERSALLP